MKSERDNEMTGEETTALAQPLTMEDVKERIAARIKASFVELMPEEAWTKMVETEIARFSKVQDRGCRDTRSFSDLQGIIREILEERYRDMLKAELVKPQYLGYFEEPGDFIKGFIMDNVPAIMTALLAGLGQNLVEHMKRSVAQDAANRY